MKKANDIVKTNEKQSTIVVDKVAEKTFTQKSKEKIRDVEKAFLDSIPHSTEKLKKTRNYINYNPAFLKQITLVFFLSIATAFVMNYFVLSLGLYPLGLSSLVRGSVDTIEHIVSNGQGFDGNQFLMYYWILFGVFNIPIIFFTYKKFNNKFFTLTLLAVGVNITASFVFVEIPGLENTDFIWRSWIYENGDPTQGVNELGQQAAQVIGGVMGGIMYGIFLASILKIGGSSGGLDPITRHLSNRYDLKVGSLSSILSLSVICFFTILNEIILKSNSFLNVFFSFTIIGTIAFMATVSLSMNIVFPSRRKLEVKINTNKAKMVSQVLLKKHFHRGHSIQRIKGGKTKKDRYVITLIITTLELRNLLHIVSESDPNAFISTSHIENVYGNFGKSVDETMKTTKEIKLKNQKKDEKKWKKKNEV